MSEEKMTRRRGNPLMQKGKPSLNPRGRPPSGSSLAEKIRETIEPEEIVACVASVMRNSFKSADRLAAAKFLSEFGWSKPPSLAGVQINDHRNSSALSATILERIENASLGETEAMEREVSRAIAALTGIVNNTGAES